MKLFQEIIVNNFATRVVWNVGIVDKGKEFGTSGIYLGALGWVMGTL